MIYILIITNLTTLGLLFIYWRNSHRKSILLKSNRRWSQSFVGYEYTDENVNRYSLAQAAKKEKLANECPERKVPQSQIKRYVPESWMDKEL
jgi:hypothetical protein